MGLNDQSLEDICTWKALWYRASGWERQKFLSGEHENKWRGKIMESKKVNSKSKMTPIVR